MTRGPKSHRVQAPGTATRWARRAVAVLFPAARAGVAAAAAWVLARALTGVPDPYLAPVAALLCLQVSVAESVGRAVERSAAVVAGLWLAAAAGPYLGPSAAGVGVIAALGIAAGRLMRLQTPGTSQVAVTALLIVAIHHRGYGLARTVDTLVGAAVAVAVAAVYAPPHALVRVATRLGPTAEETSRLLAAVGRDLERPGPPADFGRHLARGRYLSRRLEHLAWLLDQGERELRWNWIAPRIRRRFEEQARQIALIRRGLDQTRGVARSLVRAAKRSDLRWPQPAAQALGRYLDALASLWRLVARPAAKASDPAPTARAAVWAAVETARTGAEAALATVTPGPEWHAVLVDLEKMEEDLAEAFNLPRAVSERRP
ncbi:MAG: FUSC family protein [Firmicutes bacterium]|nr:FUSC family protein [Alicyclobacillaceae bacterium]MCL6498221.1 FUSC family protein [Bacillota bacterium]